MQKLFISILLVLALIQGKAFAQHDDVQHYSTEQIDSLLAPIALYPDSLLTHVLIATTYPFDVLEAARWRAQNKHLSHEQARREVEHMDWNPSVIAIAPFTELLELMSSDLNWLESMGDAMLVDEAEVLARVQVMREYAWQQGELTRQSNMRVSREDNIIVIEPVRPNLMIIPVYDTRVVYGHWWHHSSPVLWYLPRIHSWHRPFYWGPTISISTGFYFGAVHWHHRYLTVSHSRPTHYYRGNWRKHVRTHEYQRWQHKPTRKVVRSHSYLNGAHSVSGHSQRRVVNSQHQVVNSQHKVINRVQSQHKRVAPPVTQHRQVEVRDKSIYRAPVEVKQHRESRSTVHQQTKHKPSSQRVKRTEHSSARVKNRER